MATIMVTGNWCLVSGIWYLGTLLFGGRHAYDHETTLQFRKAHEVRRKEGRKKKKSRKKACMGFRPGGFRWGGPSSKFEFARRACHDHTSYSIIRCFCLGGNR